MNLEGTSILGHARAASSGERFNATDPATGEPILPEFTSATEADVDRAAALAESAFDAYRDATGNEKGAFLRDIAARLESLGDAIIDRANLETALPQPRLQNELARTTNQLRMFAALVEEGSWVDARVDPGDPNRKPLPKPEMRSMLRPLGPVAVFGASNFPLAFSVAGGDTAAALAAGCPVIVKAHPAHPGTSELAGLAIQQAAKESGIREGVFSLLFDAGYAVGIRLARHPAIRAVAFTGSRRGGQALMDAAATRPEPISVYAEMGSINPVFILPGALRERSDAIATALHASVTLGVGQFCTNPGVVVVEKGAAAGQFAKELEGRIRATAAGTMLTAGIGDAYRAGVERLARTHGVRRRAGAETRGSAAAAALFVTDAATFMKNESIRAEVFGPATLLVECDGREEVLEVARSLEGQLSITIHASDDDLREYRELPRIAEMKTGRIVFNGFPTGLEVGPATVHGGPWPATSDGRSTSVGTRAIHRFVRAIAWQDAADDALPPELRGR
jgi:NADP-dependent aldehyde dehydrogenase